MHFITDTVVQGRLCYGALSWSCTIAHDIGEGGSYELVSTIFASSHVRKELKVCLESSFSPRRMSKKLRQNHRRESFQKELSQPISPVNFFSGSINFSLGESVYLRKYETKFWSHREKLRHRMLKAINKLRLIWDGKLRR